MKAADITDVQLLGVVRATRGQNGVPAWATLWGIQAAMPEFHPKVVKAKLASAIRRGLIRGCACGCRGDFYIEGDGK